MLSQISDPSDDKSNSDTIPTEFACRKYMAKNSSDSLKKSYITFFTNHDINKGNNVRGIWVEGKLREENPSEFYLPYISQKSCRDLKNAPQDAEYLRKSDLSLLSDTPTDSGVENVANTPRLSQIPHGRSALNTLILGFKSKPPDSI